jgi:hypothetical protein
VSGPSLSRPVPVFIDPRKFAASERDQAVERESWDRLYEPDMEVSLSPSAPPGLTRAQVDRAVRVSVRLGGNCPVTSLSLALEILRLHDVLASIGLSLGSGQVSPALALARAESDPSWAAPLDTSFPPQSGAAPR